MDSFPLILGTKYTTFDPVEPRCVNRAEVFHSFEASSFDFISTATVHYYSHEISPECCLKKRRYLRVNSGNKLWLFIQRLNIHIKGEPLRISCNLLCVWLWKRAKRTFGSNVDVVSWMYTRVVVTISQQYRTTHNSVLTLACRCTGRIRDKG